MFSCFGLDRLIARYYSNNWRTETKTQWLTRGLGGRQVLHLLPPPPPTHPHCRSLIRPHHQLHKTNTYESQQERIHKSGCSFIQSMLLFLFQEPLWHFFLSLLRVRHRNHNCFVMESKLDPWAELWIALMLLRWTCCCCSRVVFQLNMIVHRNLYRSTERTLNPLLIS